MQQDSCGVSRALSSLRQARLLVHPAVDATRRIHALVDVFATPPVGACGRLAIVGGDTAGGRLARTQWIRPAARPHQQANRQALAGRT